jgi:hypothetical protein
MGNLIPGVNETNVQEPLSNTFSDKMEINLNVLRPSIGGLPEKFG